MSLDYEDMEESRNGNGEDKKPKKRGPKPRSKTPKTPTNRSPGKSTQGTPATKPKKQSIAKIEKAQLAPEVK